MSEPLVTFVMPCFGYGRYLRECLASILSLEGGYPIEVIAIHDCSPDDTLVILQSCDDRRLRIIDHTLNRGHVFSVNEGLEQARGKYVVRIDPDDRLRPDFLAKTVPVLEQHPHVGLAYGDVALIDADGRITAERSDNVHGGRDFVGNELIALMQRNFICAPTVIARREAWMAAWPIPAGLAFNDWYFNLMLARRWDFYYMDQVLADYRVHGSNHHVRISRDGTEEKSVLWLLDKLYAETEARPELESAKQAARADAYAAQYLDFATKYFGHKMTRDARRCFSKAIRLRPSLLRQPRVLRQWLATFIPRPLYDELKRIVKGLMTRIAPR